MTRVTTSPWKRTCPHLPDPIPWKPHFSPFPRFKPFSLHSVLKLPKNPPMGHVFDQKDTEAYVKWRQRCTLTPAAAMETQILFDLLRPHPGESILDIGCGIGEIMERCIAMGLDTAGIDPSPFMLGRALERLGHKASLFRGYAEDLPFDDNSFNHACLFTTLEFVADPRKTLEEAFRVAKDRVFIGVLNRYAIKGLQRRIQGLFGRGVYAKARFFSLWEIKTMVRELVGDVPIDWRSVCLFPEPNNMGCSLEHWPLAQRVPFGTFVAMVVTLKPRFRVRPLALPYPSGSRYKESLTGFAADSGKPFGKES